MYNKTIIEFGFCNIKQLLDEVEHDIINNLVPRVSHLNARALGTRLIMNYQNRGLCYLPKPKADADNTDTRV